MTEHPSRSISSVLALALLLTAAFSLLPLQTAVAAPAMQESTQEPGSLQLGEYVSVDLANGETADYLLTVPEAASYEIGIVDEDEAIAFDLVMTDADGNELFNDIFGSVTLDLEAGDVLMHFEAVDNARLEFAVLGNIGEMSTDIDAPGTLPAGGIFYSDDVSEPMYATLAVPETAYPQQVTIYFEPGEEDSFYISVEGDDIGYLDRESAESDLLRFWTHGGEFLISAEPSERRSELQLIPFLGGPPVVISVDETVEGAIVAGESAVIYGLPLDSTYDNLTAVVEAEADDIEITLVDRLYDGNFVETSFGEPVLTVPDILPGQYYLIVDRFDAVEEDLPLTVTVTGTAGAPVEVVEAGATVDGSFEAGDVDITYFLDVDQPGALVSLALASEVEGSDFDIEAGINPDEPIWSTFTIGSDDKLAFVTPAAGRYFVRVISNGGDGQFQLSVGDVAIAPAINVNDLTWGTVGEGEEAAYRLEIPEAGDLLSIAMIGPEEVDLDLRFAGYTADGTTLAYDSAYSTGSAEIISGLIEEPGIYEVVISAEFSDGGNFVVLTRLEDPGQLVGQWASEAEASSEYGAEGYSAMQATGEPNTHTAGDFNTTWASAEPDSGEQTLQLTYENSLVPGAVNVYETFNPGAIIAVEAYDAETEEWVPLWEGEAEAPDEAIRVFSPELTGTAFPTNEIRLVLDTDAIEGWNEIDAVQLVGRP